MEFLKNKILIAASKCFDISTLIRMSGQNLIFPFYHTISDEYLPYISPLYKHKNVQSFKDDIDFLLKSFQPVSIEDVYLHVQGEKRIIKPSFHLSFDDGLREICDIVLPILYQKGIPATVFVNSAFVDNKDLFFRYKAALIVDKLDHSQVEKQLADKIELLLDEIDLFSKESIQSKMLKINYSQREQIDKIAALLEIDFPAFLQNRKPYLNSSELNSLQQKGFTIGGHSIDHPLYSLLDEDEQIRQTIESCDFVQNKLNEKHRYFSFPFSTQGVKNSFFSKIYGHIDLTFGISGINVSHNRKHIERIGMEFGPNDAKSIIKRSYLGNILKKKCNLYQDFLVHLKKVSLFPSPKEYF